MRKIRILPVLIMLALFLAACAPAGQSTATNPPVAASEPAAAAPATATTAPVLEAPTEAVETEATALPAATSRGPDLHATDPTTVSLASGGLQFVEFFRFT